MSRGVFWCATAALFGAVCCARTAPVPATPNRPAPAESSAPTAAFAPPAVVAASHNVLPALDPTRFLSAISLELSPQLELGTVQLLAPNYNGPTLGELNARKLLLSRSADGRISAR